MGFTREQAIKALKATDNNPERATDWIFSHQDELNSTDEPAAPEFRDGDSSKSILLFNNFFAGQDIFFFLLSYTRLSYNFSDDDTYFY